MGISPSSPGNSVQVCVSVLRHVVVEDNVDALNIHATAEQVGGNKNSLLEVLELLIPKTQYALDDKNPISEKHKNINPWHQQ